MVTLVHVISTLYVLLVKIKPVKHNFFVFYTPTHRERFFVFYTPTHRERFFVFYTPTHREGAILQSPCPSISPSIRSHFHNRYLSFYWKKWLHIYFLFTVQLTNERVGVFLARHSVQHLVFYRYKIQYKLGLVDPIVVWW